MNSYTKILAIPILCLLSACQLFDQSPRAKALNSIQDREVRSIVKRTVEYHDPENVFDDVLIQCNIRSKITGDSIESMRQLRFNTKDSLFYMSQQNDGVEETYILPADSLADVEKINKTKKYRDYFRYMLGGSMVLDDGNALYESHRSDTIDGVEVRIIKLGYEPKDKMPVWYYTLNTENGSLIESKFVYNEGEPNERGEVIKYGPYVSYNGVLITEKLEWLYLNGDTLAVEYFAYY